MADPFLLLAQKLAANEKKIRDRALRKLRVYMKERSGLAEGGFSLDEFCKMWKGLFYCLWMQDKPLLQEALAQTMAQLIHSLQSRESRNLFLRAFWQTLNREWNGIDGLRLDKFYSLMRFVFHQSAQLLKQADWEESALQDFLAVLAEEVLQSEAPHGVQHHLIDIFLEELAKVGAAELSADMNLKLIEPFCKVAAKTKDVTLHQSVVSGIFEAILEQAPFAIEDLMREIGYQEEDPEGKKIPKCDDIPPVLQFDYQAIADRLFSLASHHKISARNRKSLYYLVKRLKTLSEGILPRERLRREAATTSVSSSDDDDYDDEFSWRSRKRKKKLKAKLLRSQGVESNKRGKLSGVAPEGVAKPPPANKKKLKKKKARPIQKKVQPQLNGIAEAPPTTKEKKSKAAANPSSEAPESGHASKLGVKKRRSNLLRLGLSVLPLRRALLLRRRRALGRRRLVASQSESSSTTPSTSRTPSVTPAVAPPPSSQAPPRTPPPAKAPPKQDFVTFQKSEAPRAVYVKGSKSKGRQIVNQNGKSKKVTFSLNKNMTAEFKRTDRSLLVSPSGSSRVPFNPSQQPQHGVLKTPSPGGRARASDFF